MVDITLSSQVSKLLQRFDKTLSSSPSLVTSSSYLQDSSSSSSLLKQGKVPSMTSSGQSSSNLKEPTSSYQNLKLLFQSTVERYIKPASPRSMTPEQSSLRLPNNLQDIQEFSHFKEPRSATPTLSGLSSNSGLSSSKQLPKFQPRLNKNSLKIASRLGESRARLETGPVKNVVVEEESFTYKPAINKKSKKLAKGKDPRWNTLYLQGEEKRREMDRIRSDAEMKERELEECAFRPNILQPSLNSDPQKTVERLNNWAKSKEIKIKEKKDNEIDKDMKECTFAPKIKQVSYLNEGLESVKGVSRYVTRGQKIKNDQSPDRSQVISSNKDIDRKKYKELVQALHDELYSLDL
jgi:hypothetical protein